MVLLSDGHQIYVNETKLALKSESRRTWSLLDYFLAPKYLAVHSATGGKSTKPALPGKIILAIKGKECNVCNHSG
ncbi:hypothetical protein KP79_PYT23266 [Mizuhopecten yessoensis]|uniref:Uncharacterized protein n=1 Tax=Mizuhopecten yessoensis TaxID=6573 RepID=A0A210PIR6_MIZYE|nr:hypothetical protein KP79_PYT23266 [Mizuhopecten yessoensis]